MRSAVDGLKRISAIGYPGPRRAPDGMQRGTLRGNHHDAILAAAVPFPSHAATVRRDATDLARRGHGVTFISCRQFREPAEKAAASLSLKLRQSTSGLPWAWLPKSRPRARQAHFRARLSAAGRCRSRPGRAPCSPCRRAFSGALARQALASRDGGLNLAGPMFHRPK